MERQSLQNTEISMVWLIQQSLLRMQFPIFYGNPLWWVEFITKYKELGHGFPIIRNSSTSCNIWMVKLSKHFKSFQQIREVM